MIRLNNLKADKLGVEAQLAIVMRCPGCYRLATLSHIENVGDYLVSSDHAHYTSLGYRVCPNPSCNLLIYVVYTLDIHPDIPRTGPIKAKIIFTSPQERIFFDATGIPDTIVSALKEAITCHANECYIAGAVMIRKTVEELCREKCATGSRLIDQIKNLGNHIIVPKELLNGIDHLRLLGNDAAHIELTHFDKIESDELEVSILFTIELLKAVYQASHLADRIANMKKK